MDSQNIKHLHPASTHELKRKRKELSPETEKAFMNFSKKVFEDGELSEKTKQLIAVAVANVTQCAYCIRGHTKAAIKKGATEKEIMEAIWVASEMRAGGAYSHALVAIDEMNEC